MHILSPVRRLMAAILILFSGIGALAAQQVSIGELSFLDQQWMSQQRALLEDLATRHLGRSFNGTVDNDLQLLQLLLDRRLVRESQTRELQAMGVIMGDLLAADLGLHWVTYRDELGRSRALRDGDTDNYLFPITMISRRREVGNRKPVVEIYAKARAIIVDTRPPLPFQ